MGHGVTPGTITEDGAPVQFIAHYWRHQVEHWEPQDTLREAATLLIWGEEDNQLAAEAVEKPDGTVILSQGQLDRLGSLMYGGLDFDEALFRMQPTLPAGEA